MTMKKLLGISLALVMLIGSVPLGFSEPLKVQLEKGIDIDQLQCDNPNHVLAQRTNGKLACVTEKIAERTGWNLQQNESIKPVKNERSENTIAYNKSILEKITYQKEQKQKEQNEKQSDVQYGHGYVPAIFDAELSLDKVPSLNEVVEYTLIVYPTEYYFESLDEKRLEFIERNAKGGTFSIDNVKLFVHESFVITVDEPSYYEHLETKDDRFNENYIDVKYFTPFDPVKYFQFSDMDDTFTITGTIKPTKEGNFNIIIGHSSGSDGVNIHVDEIDSYYHEKWQEQFWTIMPKSIENLGFYSDELNTIFFAPLYKNAIQKLGSTELNELQTIQGNKLLEMSDNEVMSFVLDVSPELNSKISSQVMEDEEAYQERLDYMHTNYADEIFQSIDWDNRLGDMRYVAMLTHFEDATMTVSIPDEIPVNEVTTITVKIQVDTDRQGYVNYYTYLGAGLEFVPDNTNIQLQDSGLPKHYVYIPEDGIREFSFDVIGTLEGYWFIKSKLNDNDFVRNYASVQ